MRHASLFSGIGGFDLVAEWMGWENVFSCEINPFGKRILEYYWPNAKHYEDIKTTDFTIHRGGIDILTGGFPCQPFSQAGKRKGTEDDRHLWPEMLRAIQEIRPGWIVGENVYGLVNWDGGLVFDQVQADLEAEGYEVQPVILPAASVNAPHRRDRVWFVAKRIDANTDLQRWEERSKLCKSGEKKQPDWTNTKDNTWHSTSTGGEGEHINRQGEGESSRHYCKSNESRNITNTQRIGSPREEHGQEKSGQHTEKSQRCGWSNFPTQSPICSRDDGVSSRLDGITFPKWRNESIKAYGNAIVPQVVYEIFKVIEQMNTRK